MNDKNLLYALIGGSVVALAWIASVSLTLQSFVVVFGLYTIAAVIAVMVEDYRKSAKALR